MSQAHGDGGNRRNGHSEQKANLANKSLSTAPSIPGQKHTVQSSGGWRARPIGRSEEDRAAGPGGMACNVNYLEPGGLAPGQAGDLREGDLVSK